MSTGPWARGDRVLRREILHGRPWVAFPTYVVVDDPDLLAVYLVSGSELAFADWPFEQWQHPWKVAGHTRWSGWGKLMLHRPGDAYSVDLFWSGEGRDFAGWYINLQDPFRRFAHGFDTLDHELDYWLPADGPWTVKDDELFEQRVVEGRYSEVLAEQIRATGGEVAEMLRSGTHWWDPAWASWEPPSEWAAADAPPGWDTLA